MRKLGWVLGGLLAVLAIAIGLGIALFDPDAQKPRIIAAVKQATGLPTIAVGLITQAQQAEDILTAGKADLIAVARAMMYNPRWPWHAAAELGATIEAPPQYWRSQPSNLKALFGNARVGIR